MLALTSAIVLALVTLLTILLQKTYGQLPAKEMKRRAQKGDADAQVLYRAVGYGLSLKVLLWLMMGLSTAGLFFVVSRTLPLPLALVAIMLLFALGFTWLPNTKVTKTSRRLAVIVTPTIAWLLNYLHAPLQWVGSFAQDHSSLDRHTHLYQKEDLIDLLQQQSQQADNRMTKEELNMAIHSLSFGDRLVRDIFVPSSQVVSVSIEDSLGPLLMGELHDSGHSRFPVYDGKHDNIVGMLYLHDLLEKRKGGSVRDIVQKQVVYAHEEQNLYQTLTAFLKTKRHLFVVVNRFEEVIGIVTIEDVLEQIIGKPIMDEFDQYEDLRAVAMRMAEKIHKQQKHMTPEPAPAASEETEDSDPEVPEKLE